MQIRHRSIEGLDLRLKSEMDGNKNAREVDLGHFRFNRSLNLILLNGHSFICQRIAPLEWTSADRVLRRHHRHTTQARVPI